MFEKGHLTNIGTGGGGFCRVYMKNNKFHVFAGEFFKGTYVREYDKDWQFTGFEKILIPCKGRMLGDHDADFDGDYLYQFPQAPNHPNDTKPRGRDLGAVYKYDTDEYNLVAIGRFRRSENERITDQNIAVIKNKIYLGSEYRENNALWRQKSTTQNLPPNNEVARAALIRVFDKDLNLLDERNLVANIEGAEVANQYWGMGASQLYADGYYYVIAQTPIGNCEYFDHGESKGARQVFALKFDDNFNFIESFGPSTNTNNDNFWCTGAMYEDGKYYISYTYRKPGEGCVPGPPTRRQRPPRPRPGEQDVPKPGMPLPETRMPRPRPQMPPGPRPLRGEPGTLGEDQGNILLSIFDKDFNELETIDITKIKTKPDVVTKGAHRSSVLKVDDKLIVSYDGPGGIWVQELIIKD